MRIREGDPLEIYTSREGEVIFKKYSMLGGVEDFAYQLCETMSRCTGRVCAIADRDIVLSVSGGRRELKGKHVSAELERIMENRRIYRRTEHEPLVNVSGETDGALDIAAPILSEGDLLGVVLFIAPENGEPAGETEYKLAQTIAAFLGKHMET